MFSYLFRDAIDRRVDEKLNELLIGNSTFHFLKLDDKNAEKVIADFIIEQKEKNNTELSTYDFVMNLRLPASQVDSVLGEFEKKKLVSEVEYA